MDPFVRMSQGGEVIVEPTDDALRVGGIFIIVIGLLLAIVPFMFFCVI